jgi:hypothetical protein
VNVGSRAPALPLFYMALRERGPTAINGRRPRSGRVSDRADPIPIRRSGVGITSLTTRSKKLGGLGFKDLHVFNTAMLARQVWRIVTHPDTLCAQVLKAKYFPDGTILDAKPKKAFLTHGGVY